MRPLLFLLLASGGALLAAEPRTFRSGPDPVPLLELFTSEGCSSCPPAEAWLADLRHDPGLWRDFVPMAWHVSYWDRLGWPDRFADPAYTDRQYAYARAWRTRRVYTPEVVRGGVEWSWRGGRAIGPTTTDLVGGELVATVADGVVTVNFAPEGKPPSGLRVHVARLGGGIVSDVRRGENRGRRLEHEFVVLGWKSAPLPSTGATVALPAVPAGVTTTRTAVAIWISRPDEPVPLQATGGWVE